MYIQQAKEQDLSRQVPPDYSGNAFAAAEELAAQEPPPTDTDTAPNEPCVSESPPEECEESVPTFSGCRAQKSTRGKGWGSLFSDIPFLSSFLPPPRGNRKEHSELLGWILIGAAVLLFLNESIDDILPLLLLLLLWD